MADPPASPPAAAAPPPRAEQGASPRILGFVDRVLIVLAFAALALLAWKVSDVFMLVFGGVLLAAVLRTLTELVGRHSRLPPHFAMPVAVIGVLGLMAAVGWLVGERLAGQVDQLSETLPQALGKVSTWMQGSPIGQAVSGAASSMGHAQQSLAGIAGAATSTFGAVADALVMLFLGFYLAADPDLYQRGLLRLVPRRGRQSAAEALAAAGFALRRWLLGQLVSMVVVGLTTGVGLALLGVPLALALGLLGGLLEFIPYIGPIIAAIPAILMGFTQGPREALLVVVFFLVVHQLEGNVLMPIVQRWVVSLPPALGILAVVVFGLLFGPLGILFATPLMVVVMVIVQKLYLEDTLGQTVEGPDAGKE